MRNNTVYGGYNEIKAFSNLTDLKIISFFRYITKIENNKILKKKRMIK